MKFRNLPDTRRVFFTQRLTGMKKIIFIFLLVLSFDISRDLNARRMNDEILWQMHIENTTINLEVLKSLSAYDLLQAQQNSGRLFIRDKIILE
ncbi:hypothetical protein A3D78_04205 [Candidatus Gottesmanbacteria bacterium RIFCSPHIGHO2_02_FULL_39_14]|uniref:Uncharacterized protein n=3 Tax=Candidatus Gottesmaniibacteriota TaxID=1752720 RepID=A0A1F5ZY58_9BACT|nr:MAG: hypothetical protein A2153_02920 [Candidatus Gottesmanbacteria bacterium RBG_16_38_7b]OGG17388.1 MAG: hypothetical protein A3D78_04205 [Candidatus Gottesmanbacteria bacterium RIFCSPHIGHO2_02_FULL_39_14]OGG30922.1 MAG: hypothetical protein A3I51_01280 [Candidatus Gottesmanbacteria bacterium RIFCSPLOWO2_02_FULL_38_8]